MSETRANLEQMPKTERRQYAQDNLPLDKKRFILSADPELRRRLKSVEQNFNELKSRFPELVSVLFYGSHIKGYANRSSDMDGFMLIDDMEAEKAWKLEEALAASEFISEEDLLHAQKANKDLPDSIKNTRIRDMLIEAKYKNMVTKIMYQSQVNQQPGERIHTLFMDKIRLKRLAEEGKRVSVLAYIFLFAIGRDIDCYRKIVLDTLLQQGIRGEETWQKIIDNLHALENTGFAENLERRLLYPATLEAAQQKYIKNLNKEI